MRISINQIKKFIQESFIKINEDNTVPNAIRGRSVEIQYYPPGTTHDPQDNKPNRRDLFLAVNNRGDTVGFGNSEEEVVRSVSGKYFIKKKKGSKEIARNMRQNFQPGQTEYVDMRHGHVVGIADERGNWLSTNESLRSFIQNIIKEMK